MNTRYLEIIDRDNFVTTEKVKMLSWGREYCQHT